MFLTDYHHVLKNNQLNELHNVRYNMKKVEVCGMNWNIIKGNTIK